MSNMAERLNAALEGRYAIERELGEGGMATVYLADDLKHQRKVALKVLKPELAAVVGAERFLAEIQVTANLQHPNILPLFDSGEADSFLYYVMPYIEGDTLKDRLALEGQLPVSDAVAIARDVAEALQAAHEQGVIHRDIKPGNILISRGKPLISDFGIALALSSSGAGGRLTETGLSLGTPYYMSPEQATGDQAVGASTDTYALGCVLYEMLVGDPPYAGSTAQAVLGKIVAGKRISATEERPSVPANVDATIRKALEKLPADRFASAQDFAKALGDEHFRYGELATAPASAASGPWNWLTIVMTALAAVLTLGTGWILFGGGISSGEPESVEQSVAVLPFVNMSGNADNEYFADGISEELLNLLAHIPDLRVPSRTSSFSFKGQNTDLPTIAAELNVSHILEGSVRRVGDEIRITAQLIEVATDSHLWSETYTRELTNVFAIQDEIAANVVEALRLELLGEEVVVRDGYRTDNPAAHDAHLLGKHRLMNRGIEDMQEAREYFQSAIDLDPEYAAPYVGLADANNLLHFYGAIGYDEAMANARPAIERALELDPELGEAYAARGYPSFWFEGDIPAGRADFSRAIELNPNDSDALYWYGQQVGLLEGRLGEGLEMVQAALDLDPLSPIINGTYGIMLSAMDRREEARAAYSCILDIAPGFSLAHRFIGCYDDLTLGRVDAAVHRFSIAAMLDPQSPNHPISAGLSYVNLGDLERAQALFDRAASLGNRSTTELYEAITSLVLNREDPARLIAVIEAMPHVTVLYMCNDTFVRNAILQTGDVAAVRRYFQRHYPNLAASNEPAVHSANYQEAVDLAWLLRMEGDAEHAERLLDISLAVLRQSPSGTTGYRGVTEAKILALQADEPGALAALRNAVDSGWRHLWWMAENDPTLASISNHPEFLAIMDEIRDDMAVQLERVREMERSGEIPPWPGLAEAE